MADSLPVQMYSDLKDQLPALIEAVKSGVEYGGDLAHRFIVYDIATHVFLVLFLLLLSAVFTGICAYSVKKTDWVNFGSYSTTPGNMFGGMTAILTGIGAVTLWALTSGFTYTGSTTIIKDLYIPEVRIIEVLNELISPATNAQ